MTSWARTTLIFTLQIRKLRFRERGSCLNSRNWKVMDQGPDIASMISGISYYALKLRFYRHWGEDFETMLNTTTHSSFKK